MRYNLWFHLQNALQSLATSTDLAVYTNKFSVKLNHRNSPYISHSNIWFEPGKKEMHDNAIMVANDGFRLVIYPEEAYLNNINLPYKLISSHWDTPFSLDFHTEKIPSYMVSNLIDSIPVDTLNLYNIEFVQIAFPYIKSVDIGYIGDKRYRAKLLKPTEIAKIDQLCDEGEIHTVTYNKLEIIYIKDESKIPYGLKWSSGEVCIGGGNFSMSPVDYTSLHAYMEIDTWFLISNPNICVDGNQIFSFATQQQYDTGAALVLVHV